MDPGATSLFSRNALWSNWNSSAKSGRTLGLKLSLAISLRTFWSKYTRSLRGLPVFFIWLSHFELRHGPEQAHNAGRGRDLRRVIADARPDLLLPQPMRDDF